MLHRISEGFRLAKVSWTVLREDKSLMLFPILSAVFAVLAVGLILSPLLAVPTVAEPPGWAWLLGLAAGYVATAATIFFNVALASCAARSLDGVDTKVGEGIAAASARLSVILKWAAIAFVVGLVLRALDGLADEAPFPFNLLSNIAVAIVGMAWGAITFLVIPVLALENVGPGEALSRSRQLITAKWGEGLTGTVSIGLAVFLVVGLPGILLALLGAMLVASAAVPLGVALVTFGILLIIVSQVVGSTLHQIFAVALHRYASTGAVQKEFFALDFQEAFAKK